MNNDLIDPANQCNPVQYNTTAKLLHWVLAALLIGLLCLGWYMVSIQAEPNSGKYFSLHKSFGIIAAVLILFRLSWRLSHESLSLPISIPQWQAIIYRITHWLLYLFMILMPLTGFLGASYSSHGVAFFGLKIPNWATQNKDISNNLFEIHGVIAWILVALIILHVLAAFKHLLIDKDQIFQRMWFK